jgi:hypothetical protein
MYKSVRERGDWESSRKVDATMSKFVEVTERDREEWDATTSKFVEVTAREREERDATMSKFMEVTLQTRLLNRSEVSWPSGK